MSVRSEPAADAGHAILVELAQELLEAQLDTVELAQPDVTDRRWQAHLDYLRGLQRRGRELLAFVTSHPLAGP